MSRSLAAGRVRRIIRAFLQEQKCSCSKLDPFSQYNIVSNQYASHGISEAKNLFVFNGTRKVHSFSASFVISREARVAWRRVLYRQPCSGQALCRIGKAAAAVSLALSRHHLLAPSVLALIAGHFSSGESKWSL